MRYSTSVAARKPTRLPSGSRSIEPSDTLLNKRCSGQTVVLAIDKYCGAQTIGIADDKYCGGQTIGIAIDKYCDAQTDGIAVDERKH